ncbi:MAG TPA: ABC transporter permease [Deltaproteobacteria bacterium]|nr:ABC transporter permease [Deltaproteobacteria bacterium]
MFLRKLKELFKKEVLILLRDWQTIMLLFFMPVALIFFMTLALQGVYTERLYERQIPLVIENESNLPRANMLEEKIQDDKLFRRVELPEDMDRDRIFELGKAQALVIIPEGFDSGEKPVEISFDPVLDYGYKLAIRTVLTSLTVEVVMGIDNLEAVVASLIVEKEKPNRYVPSPIQQTVPAYAIFAMFFIAIPMSTGFLKEKNDGTLQRLFTYAVSTDLVALGKTIPYYIINVVQFFLMMVVGVLIAPYFIGTSFHLGENPGYMIPVTLVVAAATTGFGVLVAVLVRTHEQASTMAATGAILMAVLGGIMVPYFAMPVFMKKLAMISPIYWAHQAYLDIFLRDAAFSVILPKLIVLTLFAGICFYIAGRRVKWI